MAAEEDIVLGVKVKDTEAKNSVKSLRTELRQLTNELANLEPGSEAFITAAKRAGTLRDQMDDAKNAVNAFNPEAKFQAFASAIGGVANGFSVVQGAMQLFGAENKRIEEMMAKTQAAIAIATGLNGLLGMGDSIKLLGSQIRNAIPILRQFSAAAVGAFTLGIGTAIILVISYWEDLKALITGTTEQVKLSTKEIQESVQKGHDAYKKAADERVTLKEREAKVNLKGEALDKELAKLSMERKINEAIASGKLAEQKVLIEKEYQKELKDIDKKYADEKKEKDKKDQEKKEQDIKKQLELEKQRIEEEKKQQQELTQRTEKEFNDTNKLTEEYYKRKQIDLIQNGATEQEIRKAQQDFELQELDQKLQNAKDYGQSTVDIELQIAQKKISIAKEKKDAEIQISKEEQEAKLAMLDAVASGLNTFAQLAGKDTEEGKALAIASSLISTYTAISKQLMAFAGVPVPGYAIAQAIATGLVGFAQVKSIMDVKVPSKGGGGGASQSFSRPALPPMVRPTSNMVSLGNETVKTQSNGIDQKVYVVESDITNTQNKVKSIESKATIG
jgi:hypothetical protein